MSDTDYLGVFSPTMRCIGTAAPLHRVQSGFMIHMDEDPMEEDAPPGMVRGENGLPAFKATDSAALDFFFSVVPDIEDEELMDLLNAAWEENPTTALRLIFQVGNVREGGKMDRPNFHKCLVWLWDNKPETLLLNIDKIQEHTCLKDLLQLLEFVMHPGRLEELTAAKQHASNHKAIIRNNTGKRRRRVSRHERRLATKERFASENGKTLAEIWKEEVVESQQGSKPTRMIWTDEFKPIWDRFIKDEQEQRVKKYKAEKIAKKTAQLLENMKITTAKPILETRLFDSIVDIFAKGLLGEEKIMDEKNSLGGLYGKWAPTRGGACDKATAIVEALCEKMWSPAILPGHEAGKDPMRAKSAAESGGIQQKDTAGGNIYTTLFGHRYDQLLSKIRGTAKVAEHFVGNGDWGSVDYDRMASRCRLLYGESVFAKHDKERYGQFLAEAETAALDKGTKSGEKVPSVNVGALLPHEVTERGWKAWCKILLNKKEDSDEDGGEDEDAYGDGGEDEDADEDALGKAKIVNQVPPIPQTLI